MLSKELLKELKEIFLESGVELSEEEISDAGRSYSMFIEILGEFRNVFEK